MATADERTRLKDAFNTWAKNHPEPDAPAIGVMGLGMFSARQAAEEVSKETEAGKAFLEILEHGVKVEGIDKVVERLTRKAPKP